MLNRADIKGHQKELVAVKDINLIYRGCTRQFANAMGMHGPEQIIGRTDFDFLPPTLARHQLNRDSHTILKVEPDVSSLQIMPGHSLIVVRTPIVTLRGQVRGIDIKLLSEPADNDADVNYRSLVDEGLQGSLVIRNGIALFANRNAAAIFGFDSVASLLSKPSVTALFPMEDWNRVKRHTQPKDNPNQVDLPTRFKLKAISSSGETFMMLGKAQEISWEGESAVLLSFVDMTGHTNDSKPRSLVEDISEKRYEHYANASADFFWEMDAQLRFSYNSEKLHVSLGLTPSELIGLNHQELLELKGNVNEDDHWSAQLQLLKKRQPFRDFEFQWETDGEIKMIRYSGIPIYDSNHTFLGYRGTGRDVTAANKKAESFAYHASHDALTGLVNRRQFEVLCERALKKAKTDRAAHAMCFMDLDSFKIVNDTCGHLAGDELLRQLSALLNSLVRKSDVLARLGGDEFGVFLYNCSVAVALKLANQLRSEVENFQFLWEGNRFQVGISIGLVIVDDRWNDLHALFSAADSACYLAKNGGRNRVVVYREGDGHASNRKIETHWVEEINAAISENRVVIAAQEIVPLGKTAEGSRYEIFTRIRASDGEIINPRAFLPSAERYGLSAKLDELVVDLTLKWLKSQPAKLPSIKLCSINLASGSFANLEFANALVEKIQNSGVPANKLCFELTETATIANMSAASDFMQRLNKIGVHFMLDDFGSGLSSFAYLKKLPVDYLKIDGLLVKDILDDPYDFTMVKAINEVSQSLGQQTVAEFVESPELLEAVKEIGVDFAQGYQVGRPELLEL